MKRMCRGGRGVVVVRGRGGDEMQPSTAVKWEEEEEEEEKRDHSTFLLPAAC